MAEPFLGQVILFGGDYAPENWHRCDGSLLSIQQYAPLYALLGTAFGGDGVRTFCLPDLRGRMIVGRGTGPGLTPHTLGQRGGAETISLTLAQMPSHTHEVRAVEKGDKTRPDGSLLIWAGSSTPLIPTYTNNLKNLVPFSPLAIGTSGSVNGPQKSSGEAHNNMPPYIALNYIISLKGIWPDRP